MQDIDQQVLNTKYVVNFGQSLHIIHDLKSQVIKSCGCKVDIIFFAMDYYKISWVIMVEKYKMQRIFATFGVSKKMVVYKPKFEVKTSQSGDPLVLVLFKCFHNTFIRCPRFSALFV